MLHPFTKYEVSMVERYKLPEIDGAPPESKHLYSFKPNNEKKRVCNLRTSVTGLKSELLPFESIKVAKSLSARYENKQHKLYTRRTPAEILWIWFEKASLGTIVHELYEDYRFSKKKTKPTRESLKKTLETYKTGDCLKNASDEIKEYYRKSFLGLPKDFRETLFSEERIPELLRKFQYTLDYTKYMNSRGYFVYTYPNVLAKKFELAIEVPVFITTMNLGGLFDSLWYNKKLDLWIVSDWKCTDKKIVPLRFKKKNMESYLMNIEYYKNVFGDYRKLLDSPKFWKNSSFVGYSLQLSLYHYILKKNYKNNTNFKYRCKEIHIVRLSHEEDTYDLVKFNPNLYNDRIRRIEDLIVNSSFDNNCFVQGKPKPEIPDSKYFYVVVRGRKPGIYTSWKMVKKQILYYPRPKIRRFIDKKQAKKYYANQS